MKPMLKALAHSSVICTGRTELSFNDTGGRSSTRSLENRIQRLRKEIYREIQVYPSAIANEPYYSPAITFHVVRSLS